MAKAGLEQTNDAKTAAGNARTPGLLPISMTVRILTAIGRRK
jgi:hypothetical protein